MMTPATIGHFHLSIHSPAAIASFAMSKESMPFGFNKGMGSRKALSTIGVSAVTLAFSTALGQLEKSRAQIFISPCMHGNMHNSILQNSMQKLQELGITLLKPRQEDGKNKLPEPQEIVTTIIKELKQQLSESTSRKSPLKSTSASKQINISANPR